MIKTRNQLEAVLMLLKEYASGSGDEAVTIERTAFAINGNQITSLHGDGGALVAEFTAKAMRRILCNPRDTSCYLACMVDPYDGYVEAFALVMQINPPEEADGTGRAVFYGSLVDHTLSGDANLYQIVKHPKRKAKKVPALGYQGGKIKIKSQAPRKEKREARADDFSLDENTGDLAGGYHYQGIAGV